MNETQNSIENASRRKILKAGAATMAITGAAGLLNTVPGLLVSDAKADTATHPYGYPADGLDVEETRLRGYNGYKGVVLSDGKKHGECAFATFYAIVSQLQEKVGAPYDAIPLQLMEWGAGGVVGFASLCGALNGACAAIGLICSPADGKGFISDLLTWYEESPLPTNIISANGGPLTQSVSRSNLCHTSVTNWCLASEFASGSSQRSERCARLAGDVAAMAVEMLNNGRLGLPTPASKTICVQCHYKGTDFEGGQFTRGEMGCLTCHYKMQSVSPNGHHREEEGERD